MTTLQRRDRVRVHFDDSAKAGRWQDHYDPENPYSQSFLERRRKVIKLLGDMREKKILDLGCGSGDLLEKLQGQEIEYHGIDLSPSMVEEARSRMQALRFSSESRIQVGDVEALPYPEAYFDAVVGLGLLEYLDSPERTLREALRVAKPRARLVFNVPKKFCLDDLIIRATVPLRALFRRRLNHPPDLKREKYTVHQFRSLFTDLGCEIAAEENYGKLILPYPMTRVWPHLAFRVAQWAEEKRGLGFFATSHLLACRKP